MRTSRELLCLEDIEKVTALFRWNWRLLYKQPPFSDWTLKEEKKKLIWSTLTLLSLYQRSWGTVALTTQTMASPTTLTMTSASTATAPFLLGTRYVSGQGCYQLSLENAPSSRLITALIKRLTHSLGHKLLVSWSLCFTDQRLCSCEMLLRIYAYDARASVWFPASPCGVSANATSRTSWNHKAYDQLG